MKHLGDITQIKGSEVPIVDIVTGGSPCQDLSVAGKRAGLAGERSGLFMEQIRIIKEMREHDRNTRAVVDIRLLKPRFMVWENVPGAFSSNKGEDFRAVLEETARVAEKDAVIPRPENGKWAPSGCIMGDGWSIAWRVHDAQFWGVPQRRKRIALVADFGGETAPEILFERKGMPGHTEESGKERQGATETLEGNPVETISFQERAGCEGGVKASLSKENEQGPCQPSTINQSCQSSEPILLESNQNHTTIQTNGVSTTLPASMGMGGGYAPMITDPVYCLQGNGIDRAETAGCNGKGWRENECYTLNTIDRPAVCYSQDAYDKYTEGETAATIKQSGGVYGGGSEALVIQ